MSLSTAPLTRRLDHRHTCVTFLTFVVLAWCRSQHTNWRWSQHAPTPHPHTNFLPASGKSEIPYRPKNDPCWKACYGGHSPNVSVCARVCACMCVCVWERERERVRARANLSPKIPMKLYINIFYTDVFIKRYCVCRIYHKKEVWQNNWVGLTTVHVSELARNTHAVPWPGWHHRRQPRLCNHQTPATKTNDAQLGQD